MMANVKTLLVLALTTLTTVHSESTEKNCSIEKNTEVKVTFKTRRNNTGYWISEVDFVNADGSLHPLSNKESPTWSLEINQNAVSCGEGRSALHSKIILTVPDASSSPKTIPAGYELFPGVGYYKFHPDAAMWARARQVCAEEGAQLIVINSEFEANVVKQLFTRFPKEKINNSTGGLIGWCWVGMYEQGKNGQYFTVLGQNIDNTTTGFSRWHPGQPNHSGTDDCVVANSLTGGLGDAGCSYRAPFVCELLIQRRF